MSAIHVTSENYEAEVLRADKPVLIDFWAPWCGPCRMVSPLIDQLAGEVTTAKFCKINVDEEPELAQAYQVSSIPTLAVVENGKLVNRAVGAMPKGDILALLNR